MTSAATKRNTTVVILCKTEVDARDLLEDLAGDSRIVAAHVELGDSKYLVAAHTDEALIAPRGNDALGI